MFKKKQPAKLKKSHLILLGILVASAVLLRLWQFHYSNTTIILKGQELQVLLAKTPKQWYRGLGKRESLGKMNGMLFLFPFHEKHGIVMRDMQFPLDIIWLSGGVIVDMAPNVPVEPQDRPYLPRMTGNAVLELPAGSIERYGLRLGDRLEVE